MVRDAFIVAVISGTNSCKHCFSGHVGIGSNSHYLTEQMQLIVQRPIL